MLNEFCFEQGGMGQSFEVDRIVGMNISKLMKVPMFLVRVEVGKSRMPSIIPEPNEIHVLVPR